MIEAPAWSGHGAIANAVNWVEGALFGSLAISIAVIAVASVGFLMLAGRIDVRRGAQVVLGCFIIFGAPTIAGGILGAISGTTAPADLAQTPPPPPPLQPSPPSYQKAAASPFDPYAGANLPQR